MATPGWYGDPRPSATGVRWWDGTAWTSWVADAPGAPPPSAVPAGESPAGGPQADGSPASERRVSTPLAVLATVAVVVLALLAVGATVTLTGREYVRGAAAAPPSAPVRSSVVFDKAANTVVVDELSMALPGQPWGCDSSPREISPYFSQAMACSVPVHEKYDGKKTTYANAVVGLLSPALVGDDPAGTATKAFGQIRTGLFNSSTTVSDYESATAPYGSGDRAIEVTARVNYTVAKLPSRYDDVRLVVVRLDSGSYAAVLFNQADDLPAATRKAVEQALATLTVTS